MANSSILIAPEHGRNPIDSTTAALVFQPSAYASIALSGTC
ncbi:hypothetical protein ACZ87_01800 [Candidatus Erwinia dacicola]|uniref:Uncharacterized protein n=1 Tax=Candidatus Erwinia dacicola TaxID=252393 RepID=A0A328TPG4_9GAMM|nr:hypothetical protein ACZ87_01800 [Candidatus Erwinia dacicola]